MGWVAVALRVAVALPCVEWLILEKNTAWKRGDLEVSEQDCTECAFAGMRLRADCRCAPGKGMHVQRATGQVAVASIRTRAMSHDCSGFCRACVGARPHIPHDFVCKK